MDPRTRHILAQVFNSPNLAMDALGNEAANMFIPGRRGEQIVKQMNATKANIQRQRDKEAGIPNPPTIGTDPGGMKVPDDTTLPLLAASAPLGMIAPEAKGAAGLAAKAKPLPGNSNLGGALAKAIKQALGRAESELSPEALAQLRAVGPEPNPGYFPGELFNNHPIMRMPKPPQGAAAQPFELADTAIREGRPPDVGQLSFGGNVGQGNGLSSTPPPSAKSLTETVEPFNDPTKQYDTLVRGMSEGAGDKTKSMRPPTATAPMANSPLTPSPPAANLSSRGKPMITEKNSAVAAGIAAALAMPTVGYVVNQAMHKGNEPLPIGAVPGHPITAIPLPSETPKPKARRPAKRPATSGQPGEGAFKLDPFSGVEDMDYQNFSDMLRAGILSMKR